LKILRIDSIKDQLVLWKKHPSSLRYWYTDLKDELIFLRMNNFPDEPLYTLITRSEITDFDDLPEKWIVE